MRSRPNASSSDHGIVVIAVVAIGICLLSGTFGLWRLLGIRPTPPVPVMRNSDAIGLALYGYAKDNGGNYPTGKSSTEVFQHLIDSGYITDPAILYIPMTGKSRAEIGDKLRPENVCWDVTAGLTTNSPFAFPLAFSTGYKVTYAPGADAVPVIKPYPAYGARPRTWVQWWSGVPLPTGSPRIAVFMVITHERTSPLSAIAFPSATPVVGNFISPNFKPDGKSYIQLTPDGTLSP